MPSLSYLSDHPQEAEPFYDALGRPNFVSADQAKELLPGWQDRSRRAELEEQEHGAASKLAYNLFKQKLARLPEGSDITLVTGPVAAGKSTFVQIEEGLTYEVNLSDPAKAEEHINRVLDARMVPHIVYMYITPELSVIRRAC